MYTKTAGCLIVVLTLIPLFPAAEVLPQAPPHPDHQTAQIKVRTELIQIHAVVTGRDGVAVDNLSKDDFLLREDGALQPVAFFALERIPRATSEPGAAAKPAEIGKAPTGFPAKEKTITRGVVLLADDLHTSYESLAAVRAALRRFVDEQLTDQDVVCLKTATGRLGVLEQFTQNREILRKGIDKILPWRVAHESLFTPLLAGKILREDRTAIQLGALIARAEEVMPCPDRDEDLPPLEISSTGELCEERAVKAEARMMLAEARYQRLVMVSTVAAIVDKLAEMPGQRMIAMFSDGFTSIGPGGETAIADLQPIISRAARSGVVVYTFNAKGLAIPMVNASMIGGSAVASQRGDEHVSGQMMSALNESEMDLTHGLSVLASETGGAFFNNSNDFAGRLRKMLDDNSVRYGLVYYPPPGKDPGKLRSITVAIRDHPEYKVRAQKEYVLSQLRQTDPEPEPQTGQERLHRAMSQPLPVTDIGVRASVQTIPNTEQRNLEVWIRGEDLGFRLDGNQSFLDLEVETVIFDSQGQTLKANRKPLRRPVSLEQMNKLKGKDLQYVSRLDLKPGIYHIRIGVWDVTSNRMGTGMAWLEIPRARKVKPSRANAGRIP